METLGDKGAHASADVQRNMKTPGDERWSLLVQGRSGTGKRGWACEHGESSAGAGGRRGVGHA